MEAADLTATSHPPLAQVLDLELADLVGQRLPGIAE